MAGNFEAGMIFILSKLNSKINELKAKGENNNGQIETRGEKNKLAELLAGAEKEIDIAAEKYEKQIENLPHKKYQQLEEAKSSILFKAKKYIDNIRANIYYSLKSFETMKDADGDGAMEIVDKDGIKQKYPDGSYNRQIQSFGKEGYLVERMTEDGDNSGQFRLYKNDKEYYANKDYVARKMGLEPVTKNIINKLFGTNPKETNIYEKCDGGSRYTYSWDSKTSQFILQNVENVEGPMVWEFNIGSNPQKENQAKNINEGYDKYNVRTEEHYDHSSRIRIITDGLEDL